MNMHVTKSVKSELNGFATGVKICLLHHVIQQTMYDISPCGIFAEVPCEEVERMDSIR